MWIYSNTWLNNNVLLLHCYQWILVLLLIIVIFEVYGYHNAIIVLNEIFLQITNYIVSYHSDVIMRIYWWHPFSTACHSWSLILKNGSINAKICCIWYYHFLLHLWYDPFFVNTDWTNLKSASNQLKISYLIQSNTHIL